MPLKPSYGSGCHPRRPRRPSAALTVGEVADGGAVFATGGIVDLPCVPPGQGGGQLLLHGTACTHILPGRALQTVVGKEGKGHIVL